MMNRLFKTDARRGFTLIESMATVSILALAGSMASFLILDAVDQFSDAATTAQLQAEMAIALDRATREVRRIPLDTAAATPPAPDINDLSPTWLNWDGSLGTQYQLLYDSGASALKLQEAGGALAVLLPDVTSCTISAFNADNGPVAAPTLTGDDCDEIRRILINITCTRNGISVSLRTKVYIRAIMTGA